MSTPLISQTPTLLKPVLEQNWQQFEEKLDSLEIKPTELLEELSRVALGSDFVSEQLGRSPTLLADLLGSEDLVRTYPDTYYAQALTERLAVVDTEAALHRELRLFRTREQVRIIWRDLMRRADMRETTRDLSLMADACIDAALNWLYDVACERWGTPCAADGKAQQRLVVLGMGKLGANELNLSSDIDLIFAFPENGETDGEKKCLANQDFFIRLGKKLIQALDNMTVDGFVFRVDMRLRPFGSASPLAASFDAMELYYQEQGRDWERYAMIKARVVAGDKVAGAELMARLRPFVYRKYIDFSAFESLREMKAMISREVRRKGREENVKLGSGGIREIEFIAQAFQLIRGGRDSRLQQRELCNILPLLPDSVSMPQQAVDDLMGAYAFLRNAEHAIQAVADRQTQALPHDEKEQARLAFNMGFENWESFSAQLEAHREAVRFHFANVIAPAEEPDSTDAGQLCAEWLDLWSGSLDDEQAISFLEAQGYDDATNAWQHLKDLRLSRTVQVLQQIGADRLNSVLPALLTEVAAVENTTETLVRVLALVQSVLRRSAYLVLLAENPVALKQLVKLCSASGWFSEQLAKQPILLDELIDQRTLYAPPDKDQIRNELRQQLLRIPEEDVEQLMEALRYFKNAITLRVAASEITGALPLMKVSDYLTWTAEAILDVVLDIAWRNLAEKHGVPTSAPGVPCERDFIIVGYGKVGGIELSYGSDLDLVFVHNTDPNQFTDGNKQIANSVFFTRLGQRIIHMLNTFTPSGQLYEVDMRLRPSGNSGLLVSSLKAFREYQEQKAWTWEHQALVRARVVAGDSRLKSQFETMRADILAAVRDPDGLKTEVIEMRQKMQAHLGSKNTDKTEQPVFHLKQDKGGIVDIEFMAQYQVLAYAHQYPALVEFTDNVRIFEAVEQAGLLSPEEVALLTEAYKTYRSVGHRLTLGGQSNEIADDQLRDCRTAVARIWDQMMA
ncbi:MAG: bifunctional [glutamate--ammonia ligase]-adenylyl-L-tyrosine phosphorylase/[glutamate--ammonia-ligase] adenylyltransferase [Pontibacterium sp.]